MSSRRPSLDSLKQGGLGRRCGTWVGARCSVPAGLAGASPAVSLACVPVAAAAVPPSEEKRPSLFTSCRSQEVPADFSRAICGQSEPLEGGMGAASRKGVCCGWNGEQGGRRGCGVVRKHLVDSTLLYNLKNSGCWLGFEVPQTVCHLPIFVVLTRMLGGRSV